jgi:GGDEF domain-containing protein
MAEIERALIKVLQEEFSDEASQTETSGSAEGTQGVNLESSSSQDDGRSTQPSSQKPEKQERRAAGDKRVERRSDKDTRKNVSDMSAAEMRRALLIDDLTGLGNRRAYDESVKLPYQVSIDADGLKWINDNLGHESGDILLGAIGEAIGRVTDDAYHISGDEYVVQANTENEAIKIMESVNELLAQAVVEGVNSSGDKVDLNGIGISYGIAKDLKDAETKLQQHKSERESSGLRSGRGEQPANATITSQDVENNQNNTSSQTDLLGQDTTAQQALADAEKAKDAKRNSGNDNQDTFNLTGSDSEADQAAAAGAQSLFDTSDDDQEDQTTDQINDFGEKLDGAKKDLWRNYQKAMSDELPTDAKDITLAKHFPEPDYENLIASGLDVRVIAAVKAMRDEIPAKPKLYGKVRRWAEDLKMLRSISSRLINGEIDFDKHMEDMRTFNGGSLSRFTDRIGLYASLGYPAFKSAKGYNITDGWTDYNNGKPLPGKKVAIELPNGRREMYDNRESALDALRVKLAIEPEGTERKTKLDVYRVTRTGEIVIGKKVASNKYIDLKSGFGSTREAFEYYRDNESELLELLEQRKTFKPERRSVNNPRIGTDYREGADVTAEKFASEFGFRGVQFGNYVEQARRAKDLNNAYDALLDLADVIGIPPRAISLNGSLGLAFGARGSGGKNPAAAHYEPGQVVINLTKVNGAGSLAHEWFHAMDNYLSKARGKNSEYVTGNPAALRVRKGTEIVNDDSVRPELLEAFNNVMKAIKASDYYKRSIERDKTRTKDYWSTPHELSARAFEAYLIDKFKQDGRSNDYLANITADDGEDNSYPYPKDNEQAAFTKAFDKLFETLQTKETESGVALFSRRNQPAFYSALSRAIEDIKTKKADPAMWKGMIRNLAQKGVKPDEIEWTGVKEWLDMQSNVVTKDQVLEYLNANGVQVNETVLSEENLPALPDGWVVERQPNGEYFMLDEDGEVMSEGDSEREAIENGIDADELADRRESAGKPKYSKYTVPGGENYKELLLTLPYESNKPSFEQWKEKQLFLDENNDVSRAKYDDEVGFYDKRGAYAEDKPYKSSHFDQANILAHVRFDERTDADGNKVLFINEIQSDWGQEGKKKGFAKSDRDLSGWTAELQPSGRYSVSDENGKWMSNYSASSEDEAIRIAAESRPDTRVANAPFVGKTDAWVALALKRMMRYAAENGFDKVAIINGQQAADLYDLSKQISEVSAKKNSEDSYWVMAINKDKTGVVLEEVGVPLSRLEDIVGKDLAKKISEQELKAEKKYAGLDLKVGGEGMRTFYDSIVPKIAKDVLKKLGGKVDRVVFEKRFYVEDMDDSNENVLETFYFDNAKDASSKARELGYLDTNFKENKKAVLSNQTGFTITPAMRDQIMQGLPLFSKAGASGGMTKSDVESIVSSIAKAYPKVPKVVVVNDSLELPVDKKVLDEIKQARDEKNEKLNKVIAEPTQKNINAYLSVSINDIEGVFKDGKLYINAGAIQTEQRLREVFAHEAIGHLSVENMIDEVDPKLFPKLLNQVILLDQAGNKYIRELAASVDSSQPGLDKKQRAREIIAQIAERGDQNKEMPPIVRSLWQRIIDGIKAFAKLVFNIDMTDADVRDVVAMAERYARGEDVISMLRKEVKSELPNREAAYSRTAANNQSFDIPEDSKLDTVIQALQDKNIDLKRVSQNIKKASGDIDDRWNAYLQEELYHGRTAKRTQDFIKSEIEPLINEMRMRGVNMPDFEEYLWARHAEERNLQIAKINPDMPDGGSGMTTKEARDYLAAVPAEKKKAYEALSKRVDAITKGTRQTLVNYGIEEQETIEAWGGVYKNYVPLMREDMDRGFGSGTGQGYSVKGNSSKRATGSNRAVVDILANLAQQREKAIIRGEKNRVSTALIGLAKLNPNADFWKTDSVPKIKTVVAGRTMYEVLYNGSKVEEFTNKPAANKFVEWNGATGYVIKPVKTNDTVEEVADPNYKNRDNVVVARVLDAKGKVIEQSVVFNEFNERAMRMAASLKNLDQDQIGVVLSNASVITRYFSSINTQYNPIFGIINIVRDVQGALLNLTSTALAGKQKAVLANTASAMKGIYKEMRQERKGVKANTQWSELWEEFQSEGGQTGYRDMFKNARDRAESMEHALDPEWWKKEKWGKAVSFNGSLAAPQQWLVSKPGKALFDWLSDYNTTLENSVRLAAYKVAKDEGMSKQQAASLAKNLTVNFNRKGAVGAQIGSLYAFFNASVQGTARIAETLFKDGKLSKVGKQIVGGGLLLGAMQALLLSGFDEDEPPEFVRDRNLIMPIGDGKYLTFPMPLGFNVIPGYGRVLTEWALAGFAEPQERFVHLLDMTADMFNPIGNAGLSIQTLAPTVIDPVAALSENKDFSGRPIAREDFNSLDPTPGFTRAKDTASAMGKALAYGINFISGGTDFKPGAISPTPDQIDYLIGQVTGGVGREAMKVEQTATSMLTGEALPSYKIPIAGRFYGDADGESAQGSAFYNNLRELNKHENEITGMRKLGKDTSAYRKEHPESSLIMLSNHSERAVQKLRKQRRTLMENEAPKEAIERIDTRITEVMRGLNDKVKLRKESVAA